MSTPSIAPPPYRFVFCDDELDAAKACHDEHGFAIVKDVLSTEEVEALKADVHRVCDPDGNLQRGESRYAHWFVEKSDAMLRLLENQTFLRVAAKLIGTDALTVNRSAAILKSPGAEAGGWHTDYAIKATEPTFNNGDWPNGLWFYLTGSTPKNGGLAVVADSHRADWPGPDGFPLVEDGNWFEPEGGSWAGKDPFADVPGVVPIESEPGDLVIFAARTFHAPFPHRGDEPRLSVAMVMRPSDAAIHTDKPLPEKAQALIDRLPEHLKRFFVGYASRSDAE